MSLTAMLSCLSGEERDNSPRSDFILRAGDTVESIGMVLSGCALVVQEDIWGNRNILSRSRDRGRPSPRPSPARQTVSPM